jgi:hypothetical protein
MFGGIKTMWQAARGKELYKGGCRPLGVGLPINLAAAVALSVVASAEEATDKSAAKSLVEAFVSTCVQSVPNIDRVERTAKLFGWKEIKGLEGTQARSRPGAWCYLSVWQDIVALEGGPDHRASTTRLEIQG